MAAVAPAALAEPPDRLPEASAAGPAVRARLGSAAAGAVVIRAVVVVTEPEEPNQPDDQQPHVEDTEADHEDPTLSGHATDRTPIGKGAKPPPNSPAQRAVRAFASGFVSFGVGTNETL